MKVSVIQYAKVLLELTDGKSEQEISAIVSKFALQLKKDGQLKNINPIVDKFSELFNAKNGIVEAEIITRYKLQDIRHKEIEDFIAKKYNAKEVIVRNIVDEKIQGGIIIRVGDEILDGSISTKLINLKKVLSS